ncbi:Hypothetical protein FKW44_004303 [Caligus rogercresseyi]|uniref:Uncharacterized protein n=1 Tax=Caligus rogercresseyi TaxID=217165 RepID=A0A7T8HLE3_CALRO|nr:Hypothetical protein FKW44_004303 [Caligus rogercresseyi]
MALETYKGFYSNDGGGGARNSVGDFVFSIPRRPIRSTTPVAYPLGRERATFACQTISVWNIFKALRSATNLHTARTAARVIGRSVFLLTLLLRRNLVALVIFIIMKMFLP